MHTHIHVSMCVLECATNSCTAAADGAGGEQEGLSTHRTATALLPSPLGSTRAICCRGASMWLGAGVRWRDWLCEICGCAPCQTAQGEPRP